MTDRNLQVERDALELKKLGYVQELVREMGGFSNFAVSFSIISILTGGIQLYGYGLQHGGPLLMTAGWLLVSFFSLLVALSMAELASSYPTSGGLYHWSSFLGGRAWGWFTAFFNCIGLLGVLAGVDYGLAQLILGLFDIQATLQQTFALYALILFSHATLNHMGVRVVTWLCDFSAWYHMAVTALLVGLLAYKGFAQPAHFLLQPHHTDAYSYRYSFVVGLLLAQWILTGYDASANVTEETVDPGKKAPWGIFLSVLISVVVGFVMFMVLTLSIPDLNQAAGFGDNAFTEILRLRLGHAVGNVIVGLVLGAAWLCGLATLQSGSRLLYAFSRDGGLPLSKLWCQVSKKHRTPSIAIWTLATIAMALVASVKLYSAVVSVAVVSLYLAYGLALSARIYGSRKGQFKKGAWNLGRFGDVITYIAVAWIAFIAVVLVLPPNEQAGKVLLWSVGGLTLIWFTVVRSRFHGPRKAATYLETGGSAIPEAPVGLPVLNTNPVKEASQTLS